MFDHFFTIDPAIDFCLSFCLLNVTIILLIIISIRLIFIDSLVESITIMSAFSLLSTLCYLLMDAPDVAMTEVALGSCLSSSILLNFILVLDKINIDRNNISKLFISIILCLVLIAIFTWIGYDMPLYGTADSPVHNHVNKYYIEHTENEIGIASFSAAILASYRAYDTLGETLVILIAAFGCLLSSSSSNKSNA
jgi:multicomponent Na+:H+ antiporter subunit B